MLRLPGAVPTRAEGGFDGTWRVMATWLLSLFLLRSLVPVAFGDDRSYFRRLAQQIEPSGKPDVRRSGAYLMFLASRLALDRRLTLFDVNAVAGEGGVRLEGSVEWRELRRSAEQFFLALGFPRVDNRIDVLPDGRLGSRRYGRIRVDHVPSYDRPTGEREMVTECLRGDPVWLLRADRGETYLCHSAEGYLGYVDRRAVEVMREDEFYRWLKGGEPEADGAGSSESTDRAAGRRAVEAVLAEARRFLGAPYLWGGKSREGIDCSGLVQNSFAAAGIFLPRDSNQQVLVGRLTGVRGEWQALEPGDTMFFINSRGRISHTAIYLGEGKLIEATEPVARIASLRPGDPEYDERRVRSFVWGKRVVR